MRPDEFGALATDRVGSIVLKCDALTVALVAALLLLGCFYIGAYDGTLQLLFGPLALCEIAGSGLAVITARRFALRLPTVFAGVAPSFVDPIEASSNLRKFLGSRRPNGALATCTSLAVIAALATLGQPALPLLTHWYSALLTDMAGTIFGFGLSKYIWDYSVIWQIARNDVHIWQFGSLRHLASYNYWLTLTGVIPVLITLYIWTSVQSKAVILVALVELGLAVWLFSRTERALLRMVAASRGKVLDAIAAREDELWLKMGAVFHSDTATHEMASLETIRKSIAAHNSFGVIAWGDFIVKVAIPFLAGCIGVLYQLVRSK
jgi:hypothetical protein